MDGFTIYVEIKAKRRSIYLGIQERNGPYLIPFSSELDGWDEVVNCVEEAAEILFDGP